jgi:hypothetical protein
MRVSLLIALLTLIYSSFSEAGFYLGGVGSRLNVDYQNVKIDGSITNTNGSVELIGMSLGYVQMSPGNFGYELGFQILGTNSQNLNPDPSWGTPWYIRPAGRLNYTFPFKLFLQVGSDLIASVHQDQESHYLGLGFLFGLGYRFNDRVFVALTSTNSSILFAGEYKRYLRGQVIEFNYSF